MMLKTAKISLDSNIDLDDLQSQLNAKIGSEKNNLHADKWCFTSESKIITLDFSPLKGMATQSISWADKKDELIFSIKLLWLEATEKCFSTAGYHNKFKGLCLLATYLITTDQEEIGLGNLYQLFEFTLLNSWQKNSFHKRLSPKTFHSYRAEDTTDIWQLTRYRDDLAFVFSKSVNKRNIKKKITSVLEDLSGDELTYRDWVEGGSFNFLTLDQGKYYIEHCATFFNENIETAIATNAVLHSAPELVSKIGWNLSPTTINYVSLALIGIPPEKLVKDRKVNLVKIEALIEEVNKRYTECYLKLYREKQLTSTEAILYLAKQLINGDISQVVLDKLKFIVENRTSEYFKQWLYDLNPSITIDEFSLLIDSITQKNEPVKITFPTEEYLNKIGVFSKRRNNTLLKPFATMVKNAGVTSVVALLGWRESEFGFPLSAIEVFENKDFLDQSYMPLRYNVLWHVQKTNGKTKLNREISYSAYKLLKMLSLLNNSHNDKPCVYPDTGLKKDIHQSSNPILSAVPAMWEHFVKHYPPFKELELQSQIKDIQGKLSAGVCLSVDEANILKLSSGNSQGTVQTAHDKSLLFTWKKIKAEFERVSFFLTPSGNALKKGWLYKYKLRALPTNVLDMLDRHLSEETRLAISQIKSEAEITGTYTQQVTNELIDGCIYPTPHALRHMWAEAVYRRFDGDAGWMIRSQFKHISSSMWLAYIKNKDNRRLHDKVKVKVISSLLKNYLMNNSEGYSGKLHVFLRRLYKNTSISTLDDFDKKIEEFAKFEFKDIKSNPWGYCILKTRQQHTAKCAQDGLPQRQKASPKICLGCSNNLTQSTNLEHIVLNLSNDINIVKSNNLPQAYVNSSYETLRNARNHIKDLEPNSQYLPVIENVIAEHMKKSRV